MQSQIQLLVDQMKLQNEKLVPPVQPVHHNSDAMQWQDRNTYNTERIHMGESSHSKNVEVEVPFPDVDQQDTMGWGYQPRNRGDEKSNSNIPPWGFQPENRGAWGLHQENGRPHGQGVVHQDRGAWGFNHDNGRAQMQHNQFPQDDPRNLFPRSAKMIFPKFDGGEPSEWIYKANQYFFVYNTQPEFKNLLASYNIEGKALVWFQDLFHSGQLPNWDALTQALLKRFGSSAYDDPMESLTRLRQQTSVEDYKGKFKILSNRLRDLSEGYKLSCFLSGLKEEIRLPVRMFAPKTLLAAYGLAKIQEEYVLNSRRAYRSPVGNFSNTGNYKSGGPPATGSSGNGAGPVKTAVPIQKISQAQMEERRKKGLCYSCDAKWHTGHKCPNPRLFVIESVELIEEERAAPFLEQQDLMEFDYNDGHPEISLHAITGSNHPKTMRIIGKIGNQRIVILIDSGSTHNFLDSSIMQHSQLPLVKENQIRVQIANGDHIVSEGKCVGVQVEVQNFQFITDAFVIVLAGCDMVLGVQWLVSLGSILWNFKYLTMEFSIANNSFRLQGLATPKLLLEATNAEGTREGNKGIFL
jgi:hypothetical protein